MPTLSWFCECDGTDATEALVTILPADLEGAGELRANPTAKPTPRAARMAVATPIRSDRARLQLDHPCVPLRRRKPTALVESARRLGTRYGDRSVQTLHPSRFRCLSGFGDFR